MYRTIRIVGRARNLAADDYRSFHEIALTEAVDMVNDEQGWRIVQVVPIPGEPVQIMIVEVP